MRTSRMLRVGAIVVSLGLFGGVGAPPAKAALPNGFFVGAAVNDDVNEVAGPYSVSLSVPSNSSAGNFFHVLPGGTHTFEVSGTWKYTGAGEADAECSLDPKQPVTGMTWMAHRWDAVKGDDRLDMKVLDGGVVRQLDWEPVDGGTLSTSLAEASCSPTHTYRATFVPNSSPVRFFLHDSYYGDNAGKLTMTVSGDGWDRPYRCPTWTEERPAAQPGERVGELDHAEVMVDSRWNREDKPYAWDLDENGNHLTQFWEHSGHKGLYTCNWMIPGVSYRMEAIGVYKYAANTHPKALADTECSTDLEGRNWQPKRYTKPDDPTVDYLDLYINNTAFQWVPLYPSAQNPECAGDAQHTYVLAEFTAKKLGPINFDAWDKLYAEEDNIGMLCIHVMRIGYTDPNHTHA